jgi:hypothetical protein
MTIFVEVLPKALEIHAIFSSANSTKHPKAGYHRAYTSSVVPRFLALMVTRTMTLEPYGPDRLDGLSLRVLDLCCRLRSLAQKSRQEQLPPLELHDRKALEWLDKLEDWLFRAEAEMGRSAMKNLGQRHARQKQAGQPK